MSTMTATFYSLQHEIDEGNDPGYGFVVSFPEDSYAMESMLREAFAERASGLRLANSGADLVVDLRADEVYVGACYADLAAYCPDIDAEQTALRAQDRDAKRMRQMLRKFADRFSLGLDQCTAR